MAERLFRLLSCLPLLMGLLMIGLQVSDAVDITPLVDPVRARDTDIFVILPCDFRTETYETPQITWYQEKGSERNKIMQYDIHNRLSSYGEFLNRVGRGDSGALILFRPTSEDSGEYTCEVEVDNENPSWAKNSVILNITEDVLIEKPCTSHAPIKGMIVLIAFCWLSPLVCFVLLHVSMVKLRKQILQSIQQGYTRQAVKLAAGPVALVIALCLIFTGTVTTAVALSSSSHDSAKHFYDVGLGTGLTGMLMLLGVTFIKLCVPRHLTQASGILDAETSQKAISADKDGDLAAANKDSSGSAVAASPEEVSLMSVTCDSRGDTHGEDEAVIEGDLSNKGSDWLEKQSPLKNKSVSEIERPIAYGRTIQNPPGGKVTSMVAVPNGSIMLTTASALFEMPTNECSQETGFRPLYECKSHLLMVTTKKDRLYMLAENKSSQKRGKIRSQILYSPLNKLKFEAVEVNSKSTPTWLHVGDREIWLHLTMCNPAKVIRMAEDKQRSETFGKERLLNPSCLVQNSSGQFIVSDPHKNDLIVFEENGKYISSLSAYLPKKIENEITGCNRLAIGPDDRIYASGPLSKNILVFSSDFKFETLLPTMTAESGIISSLMVHNNALYVAHEHCIRIYPLNSE